MLRSTVADARSSPASLSSPSAAARSQGQVREAHWQLHDLLQVLDSESVVALGRVQTGGYGVSDHVLIGRENEDDLVDGEK